MRPEVPASTPPAPRPSYLSVFSLVRDQSLDFMNLAVSLRRDVLELGWQHIATGSPLTGMVDQWLELYRIPQDSPVLDKFAILEKSERYKELVKLCRTRRMELTRAMPYDPALNQPPNLQRGHLLYSVLELKANHEQLLSEAMTNSMKFFQSKSWRLMTASQSLTPPYQVVHLWQVEDEKDLYDVLEDPGYAALDRCFEHQSYQLLQVLGKETRGLIQVSSMSS